MSKKYTSLATRNAIAQAYQNEFLSEREIATRLGIARSTVHYWIQRLDAGLSFETAPKTGRPRITDTETDLAIFETSDNDPFTPATDIRRNLAIRCHTQTVRNRLKEVGLRARVPCKKDHLKAEHLQKRFAFAWEYKNYNRWDDMIFSDEKVFHSTGHGKHYVYRPTATRYDAKYLSTQKATVDRFKVNVWGAISKCGIHEIHRVTRSTMNADYYIDNILEPILARRHRNFVFLQDLSPVHTAAKVQLWFHQNDVETVASWPPKGADINPIENVWSLMEEHLSTRAPRTVNELWDLVRDCFNNLEYNYIAKLVDSLPRRLDGVIEAQGGWTKY